MFSRFDTIPACDGRMDRHTGETAISISCVHTWMNANRRSNSHTVARLYLTGSETNSQFTPGRFCCQYQSLRSINVRLS